MFWPLLASLKSEVRLAVLQRVVLLALVVTEFRSDNMSVLKIIAERLRAAAIAKEEKAQLLGYLMTRTDLWDACVVFEEEDELVELLRSVYREAKGQSKPSEALAAPKRMKSQLTNKYHMTMNLR
ncbi:hypothetical protein COCOBI_10-0150 [Coccomyxa sp. Obi]|nr:hypothetical protein COCOBI_10-0150 [Coccomyxa sp. Obi]